MQSKFIENYSVGCFYSFRKSVIVAAQLEQGKIKLRASELLKCSINSMADKLEKHYLIRKIWTQIHPSLNDRFSGKLNQIDFRDENALNELEDIYMSLEDAELLMFDSSVNLTSQHHVKAVRLALKGLRIFKPKNYLLTH